MDAVFRKVGDNPTYKMFLRTIGVTEGSINIGGLAPGESIPASFETEASRIDQGAHQVQLMRRWKQGNNSFSTTCSFKVDADGTVHDGYAVT